MSDLDRIKLVIQWLISVGVARNQEAVGTLMGYKSKSAFSQILNGHVVLPKKFIDSLCSLHTDINKEFLVTGNGAMIINSDNTPLRNSNGSVEDIFLLPVSAQGGHLKDFLISLKEVNCEKIASPVNDAEFAITISGESMSPEYPYGSRVFVKKVDEDKFIEWGRDYVLDTCNGIVVKRLVPSDKQGFIRCVSVNPNQQAYAPFDVPLLDVYGVYRVLLCMALK